MERFRAGLLALLAVGALALTAGAAQAQCVAEGTPVGGQVCPTPSRTHDPSPKPTTSPSPKPTSSGSARPSPSPTSTYRFELPPLLPIPTPSPSVALPPVANVPYAPPPYQPIDRFFATGPGLPIAPGDSRGMDALVIGMLGAGATGTFALARARVRAWMIGI